MYESPLIQVFTSDFSRYSLMPNIHKLSKEGSTRKRFWYQRVLVWWMRSKWQTLSSRRYFPSLWLVTLLHCCVKGRIYFFLDKKNILQIFQQNSLNGKPILLIPFNGISACYRFITTTEKTCLLLIDKSCIVDEKQKFATVEF